MVLVFDNEQLIPLVEFVFDTMKDNVRIDRQEIDQKTTMMEVLFCDS